MSRWRFGPVVVLMLALVVGGCGLTDPERPTSQPDSEIYGEILEIREDRATGETVVVIKFGMPAALKVLRSEDGQENPSLEEDLEAEVTVDEETVVVVNGLAGPLDRLVAGGDVVALPVPGTTLMYGTRRLTCRAKMILGIPSFQQWKLPVTLPEEALSPVRQDPTRVNSDGVERAPVTVAEGRVLYFSGKPELPWIGARRAGMSEPQGAAAPLRTYRTELSEDGWSTPELVVLPGTQDARAVSVTWMAADETDCLVTVSTEETSWIGRSQRPDPGSPWGPVEQLELEREPAFDGVFLAGSRELVAFSAFQGARATRDLFLLGREDGALVVKPLPPVINTVGDEWGPRVGPDNELFFNREDQQLRLMEGAVDSVRLPGSTRIPVSECNPTSDGRWMFCVSVRYTPVELDRDIIVASWDGESMGEPIMVDDWRP